MSRDTDEQFWQRLDRFWRDLATTNETTDADSADYEGLPYVNDEEGSRFTTAEAAAVVTAGLPPLRYDPRGPR